MTTQPKRTPARALTTKQKVALPVAAAPDLLAALKLAVEAMGGSTDPTLLRRADAAARAAIDAAVRERMKIEEQELALDAARNFLQAQNDLDNRELQGINGEDWSVLRRRCNQARNDLEEALSKVPQ